jgi:1-acyl-sn-glycerol-3-phosphate acyltransferase
VTEREGGPDVSWARSAPAAAVREALLFGLWSPLIDAYTRATVHGREHLDEADPPVIFVANHSSHIDTPVILRALPKAWRRRTTVAAAADYFYRVPLVAHAVTLAFNTVAVQRKGGGVVPDAASQVTRLVHEGWSLLVYAEGTRSRDGTVGPLRSGAAVLAADEGLAIVPVYVSGTHAVMPKGNRWMSRGSDGKRQPIAVHFGPAVRPQEGEHRTEVMERVRQFFIACGAETTPDKRIAARMRRSAS